MYTLIRQTDTVSSPSEALQPPLVVKHTHYFLGFTINITLLVAIGYTDIVAHVTQSQEELCLFGSFQVASHPGRDQSLPSLQQAAI